MDDVLIVGGGSAGCVLAARLSEDPRRRVSVVEAGSDYADFDRAPPAIRLAVGGVDIIGQLGALDWSYSAMGSLRGGTMALPRGRAMGGSGAINGCIWLRGLPEDFERWASMVGPGWGWDRLAPAYRAIESDPAGAEADHGQLGPFPIFRYPRVGWLASQAAFEEACRELGYGITDDHNAPMAMGVGALPLNQEDGLRWGPARALFTAAVRSRPNLTLYADTRAVGLEIREGRATGVHVGTADGPRTLRAGEVILAAGAIGSAHLLLLSGLGPAGELRWLGIRVVADLPGVGVGLRDHPKTWVQWRMRETAPGAPSDPILQLAARYTATGSDLRGDMMLYPNSTVEGAEPGSRDFRIEAVNNLQLSAGLLRLRSADPDVAPEIDLRLLSERRDRDRLVDAIERSLALAETAPMRALLDRPVLPTRADLASCAALADYVERTIMTGQHVSSSCRLGADDDPMGVVDEACRVRGVASLRVIDGSIMPDSVRANTHATVLAMAELMAGRISA